VQDAHVDVNYTDAIKVRFGKFKVPFGLERLQREVATTFVERGLPSLLTPNRDLGVQVFGDLGGGLVEYEVGVFDGVADNASSDGDASDHKLGVARVFVRPFAHGGALVEHLGIGVAGTYGWERGTLASALVPSYVTQGQTTFFSYATGTSLADTVVSGGTHARTSAQGYYYAGPIGALAEYVRSVQHVELAGAYDRAVLDAWQGVAQWVITGENATYNSVAPAHPFDPIKGHLGAFDIAARYGELRLADGSLFDRGFADPTKSVHRARSFGAGLDWFPNKQIRFVFDVEHTWYWLGAKAGDRPPETSLVGRVQTVF
jgi:phosphate-selective porin OprO/OprP